MRWILVEVEERALLLIEARLNEFRLPQLKPCSKDSDEKANNFVKIIRNDK
jgi:DNA-directed RNA polymerase subunit H (RpoH/RPB5)